MVADNKMNEINPHGSMRRKDREILDRKEIDSLIRSEKVMHLALSDNNIPFVVPLFYVFDENALFFHSAKNGSKIEILKRNNIVCFEIFSGYGIIESEIACDFEAKHHTVIGTGTASFIEGDSEKKMRLDMIVARFTQRKFEYPVHQFNATAIVQIDISSVKGKKHGF